jgi:hypothetical protein
VSTYSTLLNRHGYGRHYRPFISELVIVANGSIDPAAAAGIEEAYNSQFLGTAGATWVGPNFGLSPVVHSLTAGDHPITSVKASLNPANLHSRRR